MGFNGERKTNVYEDGYENFVRFIHDCNLFHAELLSSIKDNANTNENFGALTAICETTVNDLFLGNEKATFFNSNDFSFEYYRFEKHFSSLDLQTNNSFFSDYFSHIENDDEIKKSLNRPDCDLKQREEENGGFAFDLFYRLHYSYDRQP